jgi:hypothetical protein
MSPHDALIIAALSTAACALLYVVIGGLWTWAMWIDSDADEPREPWWKWLCSILVVPALIIWGMVKK